MSDRTLAWAERIRSKGYLLLIGGVPSRKLAVKKATFAIEQAKSKRVVLETYTKTVTLKKLNDRIAKATQDERATKTMYDRLMAARSGVMPIRLPDSRRP
jgi:hypothetical protein